MGKVKLKPTLGLFSLGTSLGETDFLKPHPPPVIITFSFLVYFLRKLQFLLKWHFESVSEKKRNYSVSGIGTPVENKYM